MFQRKIVGYFHTIKRISFKLWGIYIYWITYENVLHNYPWERVLACDLFSPSTIARQYIVTSVFIYNFTCWLNDVTMSWREMVLSENCSHASIVYKLCALLKFYNEPSIVSQYILVLILYRYSRKCTRPGQQSLLNQTCRGIDLRSPRIILHSFISRFYIKFFENIPTKHR